MSRGRSAPSSRIRWVSLATKLASTSASEAITTSGSAPPSRVGTSTFLWRRAADFERIALATSSTGRNER